MTNNDENKIGSVGLYSIETLKVVYEQIIKILSTLASRNFEQRDYQLNSLYNMLTSISDKILFDGKNFFDQYDIQPPRIPENVIGDIEDLDVLWETRISPDIHGFLGKIEGILLNTEHPKYDLMPELKDLFKKIDDALDRIIRQDDDDFAKLVAEKLDKNPFIKREDKLVRPKVSRRLKTGLLTLDFTAGTLQYGDNPSVEISPDKTEIRLLAILMSNQRIVEYKELGEEFMRGTPTDRTSNQNIARDIQFLKRDLLVYLKKDVNMSKDQVNAISKMIEAVRGKGYRLRLIEN